MYTDYATLERTTTMRLIVSGISFLSSIWQTFSELLLATLKTAAYH